MKLRRDNLRDCFFTALLCIGGAALLVTLALATILFFQGGVA